LAVAATGRRRAPGVMTEKPPRPPLAVIRPWLTPPVVRQALGLMRVGEFMRMRPVPPVGRG